MLSWADCDILGENRWLNSAPGLPTILILVFLRQDIEAGVVGSTVWLLFPSSGSWDANRYCIWAHKLKCDRDQVCSIKEWHRLGKWTISVATWESIYFWMFFLQENESKWELMFSVVRRWSVLGTQSWGCHILHRVTTTHLQQTVATWGWIH